MSYELSDSELHDMGECGGSWAACEPCDIEMAKRMKAAAKVRLACAVCEREIEIGRYCVRCEFKVEQLRSERLYDAAIGADIERERYQ